MFHCQGGVARPAHTDQPLLCWPRAQEGEGQGVSGALKGDWTTSNVLRVVQPAYKERVLRSAMAPQLAMHGRGKGIFHQLQPCAIYWAPCQP